MGKKNHSITNTRIREIFSAFSPELKLDITGHHEGREVSVSFLNSNGGSDATTKFTLNNDKTAKIDLIDVRNKQSGLSGKKILKTLMSLFQEGECERVDVYASLSAGGYFWARCGFTPTVESWVELRDELNDRIEKLDYNTLNEKEQKALLLVVRTLRSPDPRSIATIANSELGERLLSGTNWDGSMDLKNQKAIDDLDYYLASPTRVRQTGTFAPSTAV